ncbi:DMT family transporter [Roseibium sp. M-1]
MTWIHMLTIFAIGIFFSLQPAVNGTVAKLLGSPLSAAIVSVTITWIALILIYPFFGEPVRASGVVRLPWWIGLGGIAGVLIVLGGATLAPMTGAALFFVCLIAGQLMGSALIDHMGAFGMLERPMSLLRVIGLILVFAGVMLVRLD